MFLARMYIHEFIQSLIFSRVYAIQYAIIMQSDHSRMREGCEKIRVGRRVSYAIAYYFCILSSFLSLSLSSFSSSPFTSSASRWRYIAFVSSLSTPTLKLNDGCIQQRERSHGNWMLLTCTPRFDESDSIAIQLLFNRCLLWMHALMITVQFNAAHDPSVK